MPRMFLNNNTPRGKVLVQKPLVEVPSTSNVTFTKGKRKPLLISKYTQKGDRNMNVIYLPRQYGKTTDLVKNALHYGGVIISREETSKKYITNKWPDAIVYTYDDVFSGVLGRSPHNEMPLYIDDADLFFNDMIKHFGANKIDCIAMTMEKPF